MGLFRCQNQACAEGKAKENGQCIYDFEADAPVCPKCGGDGRKNPNHVVKLVLIHFEEVGGRIGNFDHGTGQLACAPGKPIPDGTHRSSGPKAVTCPACKQTKVWRDGMEAHGDVIEESDFPVEVDLAAEMHRRANVSAFAPNVGLSGDVPPEILADKLEDEGRDKEAAAAKGEASRKEARRAGK